MAAALALGLAGPGALAATHPERTTVEQPAAPAAHLRIAVLDKIEAQRVTLAFPIGERIPLPGGLYSLEVHRYSADFTLTRPPADAGTEPTPSQGKPLGEGRDQKNPAALVELFRAGESVGQSWIFAHEPNLFQPSNVRYHFNLIGVKQPQ